MDKFLSTHTLPNSNRKKEKIRTDPKPAKKWNQLSKISQQIRVQDGWPPGEFYQIFKAEIIPIRLNLFQKIGKEIVQSHSMKPPLL